MSKISLIGTGTVRETADYLCQHLPNGSVSCQLVESSTRTYEDTQIAILIFEKYYYRSSNRASLTIVVSNNKDKVLVDAFGSGGGQGAFLKLSFGAEEDFTSSVYKLLSEHGFH